MPKLLKYEAPHFCKYTYSVYQMPILPLILFITTKKPCPSVKLYIMYIKAYFYITVTQQSIATKLSKKAFIIIFYRKCFIKNPHTFFSKRKKKRKDLISKGKTRQMYGSLWFCSLIGFISKQKYLKTLLLLLLHLNYVHFTESISDKKK